MARLTARNVLAPQGCGGVHLMEEIQVMEKRIGRLIAGAGVAALVAGFVGIAQSNVNAATQTSSFQVSRLGHRQLHDLGGRTRVQRIRSGRRQRSGQPRSDQHDHRGLHEGRDRVGRPRQRGELQRPGRRMKSGTDFLGYEMYSDSGRATVWNSTARCRTPPCRRQRRALRSTAASPRARTCRSVATRTRSSRRLPSNSVIRLAGFPVDRLTG